jgi:Ca2+-binding RTX toxin-like protein
MSSYATGSEETRVDKSTPGYAAYYPTVTALADGGWLTTWSPLSHDGSDYGVYQRRYDADGAAVGDEILVNSYTTSQQLDASVVGLADGGWIQTWTSYQQDGDSYGIYQKRYDADGHAMNDSDVLVNARTTGSQNMSSVAALADGGWLVTWTSIGDGDSSGIYQRRYDADGAAPSIETIVNTHTTGSQSAPSVVTLADGGWVDIWVSSGQDGNYDGIYQRKFDADGNALGSETQVNSYTSMDQTRPATTALADGGWLVTWTSDYQDGSNGGIFQKRFSADGDAASVEAQVNTYVYSDQDDSSVAGLADGGWVVAWSSDSQNGAYRALYQQRYDADGAKLGGETRIDTSISTVAQEPHVTALADGGWVVAWDGLGARQRHFAADVRGSALADHLDGTNWGEMLVGYSGNDTLDGGGGNDVLVGGYGNDTYIVNSTGDDVQELASQGTDTVQASVSYSIASDPAVERLILTGSANIDGTANRGANILTGNSSANSLNAGAGNDVITGGKGVDKLYGGAGADDFVFGAGDTGSTRKTADTVYDFNRTENDHLDLAAIDANSKTHRDESFNFISKADFSHVAGQLRYEQISGDTWIYGDTDGNGKADVYLHLVGVVQPSGLIDL